MTMKTSRRLNFWIKTVQALALAVAVVFSVGATDAGSRYNDLSHRTMCSCGCAQVLGECNHVGCTTSSEGLAMIRTGIEGGQNDKQILDAMVSKYGATVLAAPTKSGFNLVAWIAPVAVFLAALAGTILLMKHWAVGRPTYGQQVAAANTPNAELDPLREQIRRETGADGGF
jgi:cytochrome c-type biogenesis protein CcmH